MFFAINLKMVEFKEMDSSLLNEKGKNIRRFSAIMKKIVDCCKEW